MQIGEAPNWKFLHVCQHESCWYYVFTHYPEPYSIKRSILTRYFGEKRFLKKSQVIIQTEHNTGDEMTALPLYPGQRSKQRDNMIGT